LTPFSFHIAQYNIARLLAPINDPMTADFVAQLDEINALAEQTPGFVWRLQSDSGNATDIDAYNDPGIIVNMSVWETVEALFSYTYQARHVEVFRQRRKWFEPPRTPHLVLWWVPTGHIPTVEEGKSRLELLIEQGPTAEAFTFKSRVPASVSTVPESADQLIPVGQSQKFEQP
jgi:hypothetical protein